MSHDRSLPYRTRGRVVPGTGRGRTLGFPTANLDVTLPANLPHGIYVGYATVEQQRRPALIYWGTRPTFDGGPAVVEVYLIDWDETSDLSGRFLSIELVAYRRPDQHFPSPSELARAIEHDVAVARQLLTTDSPR